MIKCTKAKSWSIQFEEQEDQGHLIFRLITVYEWILQQDSYEHKYSENHGLKNVNVTETKLVIQNMILEQARITINRKFINVQKRPKQCKEAWNFVASSPSIDTKCKHHLQVLWVLFVHLFMIFDMLICLLLDYIYNINNRSVTNDWTLKVSWTFGLIMNVCDLRFPSTMSATFGLILYKRAIKAQGYCTFVRERERERGSKVKSD